MLVKFWGTKQGGGDGDGSVNYLLNERVKQGTAKVLKGDANLTKSLLLSHSKTQGMRRVLIL
ncbi:hypothetical protein [Helicobacter pylori]|uniref:hypothetical protein n=1 Tax=Helicobacter pylori TaxID=210 RepID=UPI0034E94004